MKEEIPFPPALNSESLLCPLLFYRRVCYNLAGLELSMGLYQLLFVALIEYLDQGRLLTDAGAYFGSGLQR